MAAGCSAGCSAGRPPAGALGPWAGLVPGQALCVLCCPWVPRGVQGGCGVCGAVALCLCRGLLYDTLLWRGEGGRV
jgi:hypothetical protein